MRQHPPSLNIEHASILALLYSETKTPYYLLKHRLNEHIYRLSYFRSEPLLAQLLEALKCVAGEFDPYVKCCQNLLSAPPEAAPVIPAAYSP